MSVRADSVFILPLFVQENEVWTSDTDECTKLLTMRRLTLFAMRNLQETYACVRPR